MQLTDKTSIPRYAICVDNSAYPASLELHKIYRVLPDEEAAQDEDIRVIDESGEDYHYPASYFLLISLPREIVQHLDRSFTRSSSQPPA
jgi:hypothetical protein